MGDDHDERRISFRHRLTDRQFQLYHHGLREVKYWCYEVVRRRNHWPGYNQRVRSSVSETQDFAVMLKPLWWSTVETDCSAGTRGWFRIQTAIPCLTLPHSPRQQAPPLQSIPLSSHLASLPLHDERRSFSNNLASLIRFWHGRTFWEANPYCYFCIY